MKTQYEHYILDFPIPDGTFLESVVLASIIYDSTLMGEALRYIDESMFTTPDGIATWRTLNTMYNAHETIDVNTMYSRVNKEYFMNDILSKANEVGGIIDFIGHCTALKEMTIRRNTYFHAVELLKGSCDNTIPLDNLTSSVGKYQDYVNGTMQSNRTKDLREVFNDLANDLQSERGSKVPTGIESLDRVTYGGFGEGNLVILAARPSVGKTATALYMAKMASLMRYKPILFSLEMTAKEVAQRFLFATEMVQPWEIAKKVVNWENYEEAVRQYQNVNLKINDSARTLDEIVTEIMVRNQQGDCEIAYIDYLGLIRTYARRGMTQAQIIGEITHRLKQLAKDLRIPIVLLCQLNRSSASENRAPQLYDLRDSGDIEQDADIVLMLSDASDGYDTTGITENCLNMYVRKNRGGKRDIFIKLGYNETHSNYTEIGLYKA